MTTAVAEAAPTSTVTGSGVTQVNTFALEAAAPAGNPRGASGYVRASVIGLQQLQQANGPVVCLDVRGNTFGLLQRLDATARPSVLQGMYFYVTGIDGGPGQIDRTGAIGPLPADLNVGCAPGGVLNFGSVVTGDFVVRDGSTSS